MLGLQGPEEMLHILDCHLLVFALLTTYISFSSEYLPNNSLELPNSHKQLQLGFEDVSRVNWEI